MGVRMTPYTSILIAQHAIPYLLLKYFNIFFQEKFYGKLHTNNYTKKAPNHL